MDNYTIEELNDYLKVHDYFVIDEKVFYINQDFFEDIEEKNVFLLKAEADKNLSKIEEAAVFFTNNGIKRSDKIVAIGGGATTDFAGYLASVLLRGMDWICVPTTVLGFVDASVGGKTAVNLENGKNLVGTFHSPIERVVCLEFLATLPDSEQVSGFCEVLKYALLDKKIYDKVMSGFDNLELFNMCHDYKEQLVAKDFEDKGIRKILNLGHTIGHAIEKSVEITHGEAICIGMDIKIRLFSPHLQETFETLKEKLRIDFPLPNEISKEKFEELIVKDKKREGDDLDYILLKDVGDVEIAQIKPSELFGKIYQDSLYGNIFK
jgi:3-dehydroquinate synthase